LSRPVAAKAFFPAIGDFILGRIERNSRLTRASAGRVFELAFARNADLLFDHENTFGA
jgi:hypothetical protein